MEADMLDLSYNRATGLWSVALSLVEQLLALAQRLRT